jgi:hypothetical protein
VLYITAIILASLTVSLDCAPPTQSEDDKAAVLATVQKFFDTMAARDVEGARFVLMADGRTVSVREQNGETVARTSTVEAYLESLAKGKSASRERMWNPEVRVHGAMASVWTPYDFWVDGKFSHCGVDAFTLIKTADGWRISSGTWTIQREGCAPSPLGPLK